MYFVVSHQQQKQKMLFIADQIFNSTIYLPYGLRLNKCGMAMAELQINTP